MKLKVCAAMHALFRFYFLCMSLHHVWAVPTETRKGHLVPWNWSYSRLWTASRCRESKPSSLKEKTLLLTAETSPQPQPPALLKPNSNPGFSISFLLSIARMYSSSALWFSSQTLIKWSLSFLQSPSFKILSSVRLGLPRGAAILQQHTSCSVLLRMQGQSHWGSLQ